MPLRDGKLPVEQMKPHEMNENELTEERDRLEALLDRGELAIKDARRLSKIRDAIAQLEIVKDGW